MSLVLSYIYDPVETLREARRIIMPGGLLILSSMRPDTDASGPFTRLLEKIEAMPEEALPPERPEGPAHRIPARLPQRRPGARGPRGGRDVRFLRSGEARGPARGDGLGDPPGRPVLRDAAPGLRLRRQSERGQWQVMIRSSKTV
ncbi:MAG: class I SAM-dependent methyltransferase [Anaerotruncus sp.]|nr:class I SAM-dependent methyltransferase [Anaerotruncus sp.]